MKNKLNFIFHFVLVYKNELFQLYYDHFIFVDKISKTTFTFEKLLSSSIAFVFQQVWRIAYRTIHCYIQHNNFRLFFQVDSKLAHYDKMYIGEETMSMKIVLSYPLVGMLNHSIRMILLNIDAYCFRIHWTYNYDKWKRKYDL